MRNSTTTTIMSRNEVHNVAFPNNYHTHTYRCKHAVGDVEDYIKVADVLGMKEIGISDHTPLPDDWVSEIRMGMNELDDYTRSIDVAKVKFPQVNILKSMECDWVDSYKHFYQDELLGKRNYDYLIGAIHFYDNKKDWVYAYDTAKTKDLIYYAGLFIEAMESGLFKFMAHPDLFGGSFSSWNKNIEAASREMIQAAEKLNIPLEINGNGFTRETNLKGSRPYPIEKFWALAAEYPGLKVICNSDAHSPNDVFNGIEKGKALAMQYGLEIIHKL